ncbi:MAG: response regulator [Aquincola tertiaricarbonis]|uniref:response regulator n=1 Tax=Aquincola TaxID=391952 RepID=UPI000614A721|nr:MULTISPECIES: response regulator [Aquincola]MCR5868647.1 response regulator [Aquincola sp. J276]
MSLHDDDTKNNPRARILIVEDDDDGAQALQALLELEGYEVCTAPNGAEGLAVAAHFDPHIVLLDLNLPVVHGVEVAQHLRVNEHAMRRVIIGITGLSSAYPANALAFDHKLSKPVDADALFALLRHEWQERFADSPYAF